MRNFQINERSKLIATCLVKLSHYTFVSFIKMSENHFIIYTIGQSSIQHTILNQLNITKQIFLNIDHFSSTLVLLKYQDPFIECPNFESCFFLQLSCLGSEFQHHLMDWEFQYHSIFKQGLS